jgi:hypothetical protein
VAAHVTAPTEPHKKVTKQYHKAGTGQSNQSWVSPLNPRLTVACEAFRSFEQLLRIGIADTAGGYVLALVAFYSASVEVGRQSRERGIGRLKSEEGVVMSACRSGPVPFRPNDHERKRAGGIVCHHELRVRGKVRGGGVAEVTRNDRTQIASSALLGGNFVARLSRSNFAQLIVAAQYK